MKKQLINRFLMGIALGISIGYIITILISLFHSDGLYYAVVPSFVQAVGSELNAVILQTILSGLLGASQSCSTLIWEIENWSITKQTAVHFIAIFFTTIPVAYIAHWMQHSLQGILSYTLIFIGAYIIIWISVTFQTKNSINQLNKKLK